MYPGPIFLLNLFMSNLTLITMVNRDAEGSVNQNQTPKIKTNFWWSEHCNITHNQLPVKIQNEIQLLISCMVWYRENT